MVGKDEVLHVVGQGVGALGTRGRVAVEDRRREGVLREVRQVLELGRRRERGRHEASAHDAEVVDEGGGKGGGTRGSGRGGRGRKAARDGTVGKDEGEGLVLGPDVVLPVVRRASGGEALTFLTFLTLRRSVRRAGGVMGG